MEQSDEISRITAERDDYKSRWEAARQRADRAEARLAHAESEYVRMGDELGEVVERSLLRQTALEVALSALSRIKSVARSPTTNERLAACWKIANEIVGEG
jgi:hypothetical protein